MVDLGKPILFCGRPVRLICTDRVSPVEGRTLVVLGKIGDREEAMYLRPDDRSLTNTVEEKSSFYNLYKGGQGIGYETHKHARKHRHPLKVCAGILEIVTDAITGKFIRTVVHKE